MAAKPVVVPTWATGTNFSAGAFIGTPTKVAPSAGVRTDGHIPETATGAQHENYDRNKIGEWLQYLSDGALEGQHSITYTGNGITLSVNHSETTQAGFAVNMPAGATRSAGLFEGGIEVTAGDVLAPRGFRQRAQAPIALRDTEEYIYCDSDGTQTTPSRRVKVPLLSAVATPNWAYELPGSAPAAPRGPHSWQTATSSVNDILIFEPKIPRGAIVTEVRCGVHQTTDGGTDMALEVFSFAYDESNDGDLIGVGTSVGSDSAANDGDDILAVTLSPTHTDNGSNALVIQISASNGGGRDIVYWVDLTFSDPGPRTY